MVSINTFFLCIRRCPLNARIAPKYKMGTLATNQLNSSRSKYTEQNDHKGGSVQASQ